MKLDLKVVKTVNFDEVAPDVSECQIVWSGLGSKRGNESKAEMTKR